ncbi:MAG: hypothetical protein ACJ8DZ_13735 [Allosphingosinicella sp.]
MSRQTRARARAAYASAFLRRSPRSGNLARNIIDGEFENWWITPALDALEVVLRGLPDEGEDEGGEEGGGA